MRSGTSRPRSRRAPFPEWYSPWRSSLDRERLSRVSSGLSAAPPVVKDPVEVLRTGGAKISNGRAFYVVRDRFTEFVKPDGAAVWGVGSFAELSAHSGADNPNAGEPIGIRAPVLKGAKSRSGSGIRLAVADRDAVFTALGSSGLKARGGMVVEEGQENRVPRIAKSCGALSGISEWRSGECVEPGAMAKSESSASWFSEQYASESGFKRRSGRAALGLPRASLLAPDYPLTATDSA